MDAGKLLASQWDRALALLMAVMSLGALVAGWLGVSRHPYVAEQLAYMVSGALGAILLLGVAATLWLSADLRDEWRKLDRIDQALRALAGTDLVAETSMDSNIEASPREHT